MAAVGAVAFVVLAVALVPWNPVPGGGPTTLPARDTILGAAQLARAEDYSGPARYLGYGSLVVSLAVTCWLGFTRAGLRLVGRLRGWWWVRVILGVAAVNLVGRLSTLPFSWVGYRRRVSYGLSTQAWPDWLRDVAVSWLVNAVGTALVVLVVVGTARRWRTWWPAVAGGIAAVLVMLGSFVYPLLVEPLFNQFTPLPDGPLRTAVLRLADEEGVHVDDVLEADASRRTTTLNAYVSGYGSTRRVVLYDNLVRDVPRGPGALGRGPRARARAPRRRADRLPPGSGGGRVRHGAAGRRAGRAPAARRARKCNEGPGPGSGAEGPGPGGGGGAAGQPCPERHQPPDRDPGRCRCLADDPRSAGFRGGSAAAGDPVTVGPAVARLVPVLVRQPPDDA